MATLFVIAQNKKQTQLSINSEGTDKIVCIHTVEDYSAKKKN